jgi:hypothetical protein
MRTTVENINTNDDAKHTANIDNAPYAVLVNINDDEAEWHESADVTVFVERSDAPLSGLRKQAIERTRVFLTKALEALSGQA